MTFDNFSFPRVTVPVPSPSISCPSPSTTLISSSLKSRSKSLSLVRCSDASESSAQISFVNVVLVARRTRLILTIVGVGCQSKFRTFLFFLSPEPISFSFSLSNSAFFLGCFVQQCASMPLPLTMHTLQCNRGGVGGLRTLSLPILLPVSPSNHSLLHLDVGVFLPSNHDVGLFAWSHFHAISTLRPWILSEIDEANYCVHDCWF
jgi:hypothetical protein